MLPCDDVPVFSSCSDSKDLPVGSSLGGHDLATIIWSFSQLALLFSQSVLVNPYRSCFGFSGEDAGSKIPGVFFFVIFLYGVIPSSVWFS